MLGKGLKTAGAITGTFTIAAIATGGLSLVAAGAMLATDAALLTAGHHLDKSAPVASA